MLHFKFLSTVKQSRKHSFEQYVVAFFQMLILNFASPVTQVTLFNKNSQLTKLVT